MVNRVAIGAEVGPHAPLSTSLGVTMTEIIKPSCEQATDRAGDNAAMRVLIVGANNEQVASAIGIAVRQGATLRHVATPEAAVQELCAGRGADLLLVDVVGWGRRDPRRGRRRTARAGVRGSGDERSAGHGTPDRAVGRQRADHWRERHRQGDPRALRVPPQPPRGTAVRLGQLRRHPGEPAGIRAVRPREGRLHRRRPPAGSASSRRPAAAPCCLDEISEMDLRLQAKLLRAIQEREIDRVGGTRRSRSTCA